LLLSPFKTLFALKTSKKIPDKKAQEGSSMKKAAASGVWKNLMVLGEKQGAIKLADLAQEMGLKTEEAMVFIKQVFPMGKGIDVYHKGPECWVDIKSDAVQYMLPLSAAEWIQLYHILSHHQTIETSVVNSLKKKVTDNGPLKNVVELLTQLELWDQELNDFQQKMVHKLDDAINEKKFLSLKTTEDKQYSVYPCKLVHLEGQLSLIAEDSQDHCLLIVPLKDLKSFDLIPSTSEAKVTPFEIEEFITAVRAMNEKETRLILKIHDPQSTNLFPDHHFLGKPCMVTNPTGDLIWAAYVEPCGALFEWLMTLGKKVEILDPVNFKEEYLDYCEEKMRKIA
jgi:predicted DNA-binding transcriptional regulator YafY